MQRSRGLWGGVLLVVALFLLAPGSGCKGTKQPGVPELHAAAVGADSEKDAPSKAPRPVLREQVAGPQEKLEPEEQMADVERPDSGEDFDSGAVGWALKFKDEVSPYRVMSTFVMPGSKVRLEAVLTRVDADFTIEAQKGRIQPVGTGHWEWTAPEKPGLYPIRVTDTKADETITLNVFVLTPYAGQERLNGYRIGHYQRQPLRGDPAYAMPRGFIEVTKKNQDTWLTPHFQLKQFLCKQQPDHWPKYLLLRERALLKLEMLLERVNERGYRADTFFVMSGYRTPWYNKSIGNRTIYSRHSYGDATDIFIDQDRDGVMDDLDGDGQITLNDGRVLHDLIGEMEGRAWVKATVGGLHVYPATSAHGPMVHVDTRGTPSRW
jgi:hypothetical protein